MVATRRARSRSTYRKRRTYGRGKSMRKRFFKKRRIARAKSLKRFGRRLLTASAERKRLSQTFFYSSVTNGDPKKLGLTTAMAQGDTSSSRTGESILGAGMCHLDISLRYDLSSSNESNSGFGPVAWRQNYFDFWIVRDTRGPSIDDEGVYSPPADFSIFSILVGGAGGFQYKWPRMPGLNIVMHRRIKFDLDDDDLKKEERLFRMSFSLRNKQMKWYGPNATDVGYGQYYLCWLPNRILMDGQTTPAPLYCHIAGKWEFSYTDA